MAQIDDFLLMAETLDEGILHGTGWTIVGLGDVEIIVAGIVGDQVTACCGIRVLHLQVIKSSVQFFPGSGTLCVKQNAIARAHHRHLREIINIVFTEHLLAERRATVPEDVNLRQVAAQTPCEDVIGSNLVDAAFLDGDLNPLALSQFAGRRIITLFQCLYATS